MLFLAVPAFCDLFLLKYTLLNPDFIVSQMDRLDVCSLAGEMLAEEVGQGNEFVTGMVGETVLDLEPWIREEARALIFCGYDYLSGRQQTFDFVIDMRPVKSCLKDNCRQAVYRSLPPALAGATPQLIDRFVEEIYQQRIGTLPESIKLNESYWGEGVQDMLDQARRLISYISTGYYVLPVLIMLLITGIFLATGDIRRAMRSAGITFTAVGAIQLISIFLLTFVARTQVARLDLGPSLKTWLPQLLNDFFAPLQILSIVLVVSGLAAALASILPWGRRPALCPQAGGMAESAVCPRCGAPAPSSSRYCSNCGGRVA